jgi:2OG-Fe(II) oxygenase superfamily
MAELASRENVDLTCPISRRSAPPIPGLFFDPSLLLQVDLAESVLRSCMGSFFVSPGEGVNQVMLFGRAGRESGAFPPFLSELLAATSALLMQHPTLPRETHAMLFPPASTHASCARQAIINLYRPGEGIASHVDLLRRFGDGIVGVSLGEGEGGVAMRFARAAEGREAGGGNGDRDEFEVWLPSRSVLVLTREARYEWTHGIAARLRDKVEDGEEKEGGRWQWQERGVRVSVTFRWLLPGADIVGGDSISDDDGEYHHQMDADE